MSRYTGPRLRACRALGIELPGLTRKKAERRPYPPGQHGGARRKISEYGLRLIEKQKLCMNYGLTDRQLQRLFVEARRRPGNTADLLIELLERRLDNVIFRAGFARTIPAARQLVCHGHIQVDGTKVDIASFRVRQRQVVALRERSKALDTVTHSLSTPLPFPTPWLTLDEPARSVTVSGLPGADSIPFPINMQLVVEFYSRKS